MAYRSLRCIDIRGWEDRERFQIVCDFIGVTQPYSSLRLHCFVMFVSLRLYVIQSSNVTHLKVTVRHTAMADLNRLGPHLGALTHLELRMERFSADRIQPFLHALANNRSLYHFSAVQTHPSADPKALLTLLAFVRLNRSIRSISMDVPSVPANVNRGSVTAASESRPAATEWQVLEGSEWLNSGSASPNQCFIDLLYPRLTSLTLTTALSGAQLHALTDTLKSVAVAVTVAGDDRSRVWPLRSLSVIVADEVAGDVVSNFLAAVAALPVCPSLI